MEEGELIILRTQAAQAKESMQGCPKTCFAARFLRDYVKMFDLFEESEERYLKLEVRYQKLDRYVSALEESNVTVAQTDNRGRNKTGPKSDKV